MPSSLLPTILERLDATARELEAKQAEAAAAKKRGAKPAAPPENWDYLVLAALDDGAEGVETVLGTAPKPPRTVAPEPAPSPDAAPAPEPPGAYLASITVEGFRGIGPRKTLEITPGPGLTLVVGRNGSGKSSFAEALELLLTGTSYRWEGRTAKWREGWRCLHHDRCAIEAELVVDGQRGTTRVWQEWGPDDAVDDGEPQVQAKGKKVGKWSDLGWDGPLETYRPILSYSELGSLLEDGQASLYDAIVSILGLDDLGTAQQVLKDAITSRDKVAKAAENERRLVAASLAKSADERARIAHAIVVALDVADVARLDELESIVLGTDAPDNQGALALLRRLASLECATTADAESVATALREADSARRSSADTLAERHLAVADLIERALDYQATYEPNVRCSGGPPARRRGTDATTDADASCAHESRGQLDLPATSADAGSAPTTLDCPVCGAPAALTPAWRTDRESELTTLRSAATAASDARRAARAALDRARALAARVPPRDVLTRAADLPLAPLADLPVAPVLAAADRLSDALSSHALPATASATTTPDLLALATTLAPTLADALGTLRAAAAAELARRDDAWLPVRRDLARWLPTARAAAPVAGQKRALKFAADWLRDTTDALRNERFAPIKAAAQEIWNALRLQSNVTLGDVRLAGTGTQRRVDLAVAVDGYDGDALGVMSQGELHALALSLFIPRATRPESPFRFLVVDDPVQSMDPARVDGLARVLHEAAKRRQVLVFTHDDRLPESLRRLALPATVVEVTRRERSVVDLRPTEGPVHRYIKDAFAVDAAVHNPDDPLPAAVARNPQIRSRARVARHPAGSCVDRAARSCTDFARRSKVIPGLCRHAVEAACMEAVRRRRLADGTGHAEVEEALASCRNTRDLMALALFDNPARGADVLPRLDKASRAWADAYRAVNEGAHGKGAGPASLTDLIRAAEDLSRWVREQR